MKNLIILFLILFSIAGCSIKKDSKEMIQLSEYFQNSNIPAAIMGSIDNNGKTEWISFGPSIWGETDTVSEDHIFRIYSMTKAISSVAALQLVEKNLLGLDYPLNELMPEMITVPIITEDGELIISEKVITLRHLLTHTSGFGYDFFSPRLLRYNSSNWEIKDMRRLFEPGKKWQYGISTDWLGWVIEKVSGQDLETYFRDNITGPLQMNSTWFNVPDEIQHRIVSHGARDSSGYQEFPRIPNEPTSVYFAGRGLFSSPKDYLTFLQCILNDGNYDGGQLLKPETVALLFENQLPSGLSTEYQIPDHPWITSEGQFPDNADKYSFSWAIENNEMEIIRPIGTGYWAGLANSYFTIDKSNKIAIVYFTQFFPFNDVVSYDFYRLYQKTIYSRIKPK